MTTYLIYPDNTDGFITSYNTNLATAQAGSTFTLDTTATTSKTGMGLGSGYYLHQNFVSYDTSVIADADEIIDATLTEYSGYATNQSTTWSKQFRSFNWTSPLTTAQWQTPALAATRPLAATINFLFTSTPYQWRSTGNDALINTISKTAATKFVVVSDNFVAGRGTSGTQEIWSQNSRGANRPYLTVYTTALTTLNGVTEAATTLPDGTSVSIRSNGTAGPTLTVGYTPLNGSWTTIATLNASFTKTIDGSGALAITNDPAGNFFVIGVKAGTTGTLIAQGFKKLTSTTWAAQNPISQDIAAGNGSTVRSIDAAYAVGGTDGTDQPSVYVLTVRGSGSNSTNVPYHVSGAGWAQDHSLYPANILAGSGTLLKMTTDHYNPLTQAGIPVTADVTCLDGKMMAVYIARGKFDNKTVGGVSTINIYNGKGQIKSNDQNYLATGSSQLVAVNSNVFAHIFDNGGTKLTLRFYNTACQILGETSIPNTNFYGSQIGNQFAAHYDKTSNLVRVYYVDVSSSRSYSRWDVSPSSYTGVVTTLTSTNVGATGSLNTDLRISTTSDERRVLIESSNNAAGVLSTVSTFSTVGNIAPNAPSLTPQSNFDATSASTFTWTPGDSNAADYQTAFDFEVSRVSDSVVVYAPAKVTSTISSMTVPASTLVNATNYRWRVRTYDVLNTAGTWSGYGTFTTAAVGTLTITDPAVDDQNTVNTAAYTVLWNYTQSGGATQAKRQVKVTRTSDSVVISDTTMQVNTTPSYTIGSLESGKEYRIDVSLINSASITVPTVSRLITPNYSTPMTPTFVVNPNDSYLEIVVTNPTPLGDRPEVLYNDIYKRKTSATSVDTDFVRIATVNNSATYHDYAVKSGATYDYRIVGRTT